MMGTSCSLKWRDHSRERIWNICPSHPIAADVDETFVLEDEEMYGEFFDIPTPDDVIFLGWYNSGEVFRSGCTFTRGNGKIFYFQPGHETNPAFKNENVQKIIKNAVRWACPQVMGKTLECIHSEPYENA
jgi:trehalose utilization protein